MEFDFTFFASYSNSSSVNSESFFCVILFLLVSIFFCYIVLFILPIMFFGVWQAEIFSIKIHSKNKC